MVGRSRRAGVDSLSLWGRKLSLRSARLPTHPFAGRCSPCDDQHQHMNSEIRARWKPASASAALHFRVGLARLCGL